MPIQTTEMKQVPLELSARTVNQLDAVAKELQITRTELLRRGAELCLYLEGIPESNVRDSLIEVLKQSEKALSNKKLPREELSAELAASAFLASELYSLSLLRVGKDKSNVLEIYFRSILAHYDAVTDSNVKFEELDMEAVRQDVSSFLNILPKLRD